MRIWLLLRFLISLVRVLRLILRNPRTPLKAKILFALAVGYLLLPFDLIPITVPVLGILDDVTIVSALLTLAAFLIPRSVITESREKARKVGPKELPGPK